MIKIALVDDDQEHLEQMKFFLKKYSKQTLLNYSVVEYRNGLNFVEEFDGDIDILFLDIEMPHLDGIETAKRIRDRAFSLPIVFITNMAQYAIKGYEVNAIDFIVKPIGYYVFVDKLEKAMRFIERNIDKDIVIETEDGIVRLKLSQIIYAEKDKNYLIYHTKDKDYRIRGTMIALETALEEEGFSICINGCMVNLEYVTKISKDVVETDWCKLPLSRQRRKKFREDFMKYIGGMC